MRKIANFLAKIDLFPKVPDNVKIKSNATGTLSILSYVIIGILILSEVSNYLSPHWISHVDVDTVKAGVLPNIYINVDMTFPDMKCSDFGLDVTEITGSLQLGVTEGVKFDDKLMGGCRMHGVMKASRVSGEFHVAFGKIAFQAQRTNQVITATQKHTQGHIHQFTMQEMKSFKASHKIHHLSFSNKPNALTRASETPLNGKEFKLEGYDNARYTYYINVIPILYKYPTHTVRSYQLSVNERNIPVTYGPIFAQPGVFFKYELSPYIVINELSEHSLSHSLASTAAIIGGVWIIFGWISKLLNKKTE